MHEVAREARGWQPWGVGCHWSRGEHTISTYRQGQDSGYVVTRRGGYELGRAPTFEEAERLAERRRNG